MVQVRETRPQTESGELDVREWITRLQETVTISSKNVELLIQAYELAKELEVIEGDKVIGWGKGYTTLNAGLDMVEMLASLQLDAKSLVAGLLYRSVREGKATQVKIEADFGRNVSHLIDGVRQMAAISRLSNHSGEAVFGQQSQEQSENVRRMLVAMVDDVRVALIKLAERTCAMRAIKNANLEKRQRVAREVSEIYAPLAHRLGIGQIKWELEDLSFRYLRPYDYKYIAKLLDERRLDRQEYIEQVTELVHNKLTDENIASDVSGRVKHIYSIWRKMRRKNIGFSEVYDIRAVRILVGSERECYAVLGIVHALWRNIPMEFDDYIANPKENGYRSLHTAVHGPNGRVLEVQIRTHSMHEEAEFGVCAHWVYKDAEKGEGEASYESKITWLRQVLEWHEEVGGTPWDDHLGQTVEQDRIYLFTPDGHVIDLPENATPVDFAFRIHSDVGLKCRGAKVNGRIVPLNHPLKTADQIEILTGKRESPSRDWLNPGLGYVTTSRARARLYHWFKLLDRDQNIADGRAMLDKEFKRLTVKELDYDELVAALSLKTLDDLYAAVGMADMSVERVLNTVQKLSSDTQPEQPVISIVGKATTDGSADVFIDGVGGLLSQVAQCCSPVPGDSIIGFITQGRGVSIHRHDCANIIQHQAKEPDRIITVNWADAPSQLYSATILISAFDRHGLLRDITMLLDREKINVSAMHTLSNKEENTVEMALTIEIPDFGALSRVFSKISQLPNITSVSRKQ